MNTDEQYMQKALDLAKKGKGFVSPNPMVGCIIVYKNKIIGEGFHEKYGKSHAEVNAVNSVIDKTLISKSTVYVTLEPCSHYGKTPPCADLLVKNSPQKVVICNLDPNPLVAGNGIKKLEENGIEVITGILEKEGLFLNRRFFTFMIKKRPYIILKWAETLDGFIARKNYDSKWISGESSRKLVHQWRIEEDAIMVGTNTAHYDNPTLNIRFGLSSNQNPIRIVLDKKLRLSKNLNLFDNTQETICLNLLKNEKKKQVEYLQITDENDLLRDSLEKLYQKNIQSIIIEGGATLLNTLIKQNLWDECRIFVGNKKFEEGILAPTLDQNIDTSKKIEDDLLNIFFNS